MQSIATAFRNAFDNESTMQLRITVYPVSGSSYTITEANIIQGTFKVDRSVVNGNTLAIGTAISSEMSFTLDNRDGTYDDYVFEGAQMQPQIKYGSYYLSMGTFTVDSPPRKQSTIKISALDGMMHFERAATAWSGSRTVGSIINLCCNACGVALNTSGLSSRPNYSYSTTFPDTDQTVTYRNLIQWCAALMGTCAYITEYGYLCFGWYSMPSNPVTVTEANRYQSDTQESEITITGFTFTDDEETTYTAGTDDYAIDLSDNLLIQDNISTALTNIYNRIGGFTYLPYSASIVNAPYLWPLDMIYYVRDDTTYTTIVTNMVTTVNGVTTIEGKGETQQITGYSIPNAITAREAAILARAKRYTDNTITTRDGAVLDLNEYITTGSNLYSTTISGVTYYHDASTLAASTSIYVFNSNGFGWTDDWNNGNPTWQYGITAKGNAVLNMLSVYKISADYIYGGSLTLGGQNNTYGQMVVLDASGNTIGSWDKDGISVYAGSINVGSKNFYVDTYGYLEIHYESEIPKVVELADLKITSGEYGITFYTNNTATARIFEDVSYALDDTGENIIDSGIAIKSMNTKYPITLKDYSENSKISVTFAGPRIYSQNGTIELEAEHSTYNTNLQVADTGVSIVSTDGSDTGIFAVSSNAINIETKGVVFIVDSFNIYHNLDFPYPINQRYQ